mmetsp:Transcript_112899/g.319381  ORF Transcript_112899/g.319381 Transcript_112899/m.319381 type:complete len:601 (-) Transcript_112899:117-1919(-)
MTVQVAPEQLRKQLLELDRVIQAKISEDNSFRTLNVGFNLQNETTQLLMAACEKLAVEKDAMQKANFEEHTSELPYLCRHFNTAIDSGLADSAYRDKQAATQPASARRGRRRSRGILSFCCQQEFPPQQSWWTEVSKRLDPTFQVLRAGKLCASRADALVPGDILYLRAGQRAPVDGRVLVHADGTAIDMSQVTSDASDVRHCSADATEESITASCNMVLRDSYVVRGSLFCMAVRTSVDSLFPGYTHQPDEQFSVDVTLPPNTSVGQCRAAFKALCVQARLACRSFRALAQFARARALVVLLTQELLETAPALSTTARRLGRVLLLVDCDCGRDALGPLSKETGLGVIKVDTSGSPGAEASQVGTPHVASSSSVRSFSPVDYLELLGEGERGQLTTLAESLSETSGGAILTGLSQAGLTAMCRLLRDKGLPPLYAMGSFHFPDAFKSLVLPSKASDLRTSPSDHAAGSKAPQASVMMGDSAHAGQIILPPAARPSMRSASSEVPAEEGHRRDVSRVRSTTSYGTASAGLKTISRDPAVQLRLSASGARSIELLVSLDAIGVVSEQADCVLLKQDLGCLGQALEIAVKAVPEPSPTDPAP